MARVDYIKKARKPNPVVTQDDIDRANSGEGGAASYYKWSFRYGGTHYSKTYPRQSQLTQSEYYSAVYKLQEEIQDFVGTTQDSLRDARDGWVDTAREIGDECLEKFENMPEGFQCGDTGQLLEQRAEAMDAWAGDLEAIDLEDEDYADSKGTEDRPTEDEWVADKLDELRGVEPDIA